MILEHFSLFGWPCWFKMPDEVLWSIAALKEKSSIEIYWLIKVEMETCVSRGLFHKGSMSA